MTWGKNGGYHTQVYPRLKLLHIQFCVGQRNKTYRQPLADPFPRLQTLICRGHFPFSTPIVLTEGHSHIRHLDIDLDTDLLQTYADHRVFAKGSFPHLYYVSLGWAERDTTSRSYISMELYSMTVELCATAQIMRINSTGTTAKNDTMLKIHLATNLRVLDMPRHKVPFTELIPLLSGLPALQKARVVLGDVPTQNMLRMPTFEQINEYRELFKSHSTSAWALGISDLVFGNSRRAAEFLVLLVDILSSIKRVSISYNCTRTSYKVVNAVEFVKRRKIYKSNPAIEDVEFVSSASW
ncbi:hypothetical protein LPJ70_007475 [Coemansia sp. RSA 2708]|nr:hypothetical protein LPJ70_007475 [Coemansia sp. RSA 2708]